MRQHTGELATSVHISLSFIRFTNTENLPVSVGMAGTHAGSGPLSGTWS